MSPELLRNLEETFMNALRIMAGFLFLPHGAQKLFGWFDGNQAELFSLMGLAGVIEFFGGLLILLGLFTRPVALICSGQMAAAYFIAHAPQGFWPIENAGELAALYCFVFLYFVARGPGRFSLDALVGGDWRRGAGSEREVEVVGAKPPR